MNHPQMFVAGITLAFFLVPELLVLAKIKVPLVFNILAAFAAFLISYSMFVPS